MLKVKPTANLTGVTISGDYDDLSELVDSIHRITSNTDDPRARLYGVNIRLLGLCYDLRHAYQGDREIFVSANGMTKELMKYHKKITPTENVYYSVNVIFTEAVFIAVAGDITIDAARIYYGLKAEPIDEYIPAYKASEYVRDKANLELLFAGIWQAVADVVGEKEYESIKRAMARRYSFYYEHYLTQFLDKCNIEYLKTALEARPNKLKSITRRFMTWSAAYGRMRDDMTAWAKENNANVFDVRDSKVQYPENIVW